MPPRKENHPIARPSHQVRSTPVILRIAIRRAEPHFLSMSERARVRAVRSADANVRPIMAWITRRLAVLPRQPLAVGRPSWSKINMAGLGGDAQTISALGIARPNLISRTGGKMESHAPPIAAEAKAVRKSLVRASKFASVRSIQVHAE